MIAPELQCCLQDRTCVVACLHAHAWLLCACVRVMACMAEMWPAAVTHIPRCDPQLLQQASALLLRPAGTALNAIGIWHCEFIQTNPSNSQLQRRCKDIRGRLPCAPALLAASVPPSLRILWVSTTRKYATLKDGPALGWHSCSTSQV